MTGKASLDEEFAITKSSGKTPRLMLHCCCAPCSSYVLEYLSRFFEITILYYNPNIQPREEYDKRAAEFQKLLRLIEYPNKVDLTIGNYDSDVFEAATRPFWDEPEGGRRCRACFQLRLGETAKRAGEGRYDFFTTTMSVSPHKNAALLNEIGSELGKKNGAKHLYSDFKKRDGYKRSIELSKQYGLYRQTYCGCLVSKKCSR